MPYTTETKTGYDKTGNWIERIRIDVRFSNGSRPCRRDSNKIFKLINLLFWFFQDTANDEAPKKKKRKRSRG